MAKTAEGQKPAKTPAAGPYNVSRGNSAGRRVIRRTKRQDVLGMTNTPSVRAACILK
ncbi:hypothetical protein [Methanoregula sp.]|uniref:hypothetical protein n=1 Tax=Methanoregula sp. TaxID=2052170 RepID=UPI00260768B6|nr:hypothetical protein [Methanoregula sp.]MDD5144150.1 hypothetical protein [Methanoregula sp.]